MATIAVLTLNGVQYEVEDTQARNDLLEKQATLTFDLTPLVNSSNPVTSDGIARSIANFITANVNNLVNYYTKTEVDAKLSPVYKPAGSCASVAALGSLDASHEGFVYDMSAEFTTTSDFKDYASQGAKTFPAGTQVAIVNVGTAQSPTYMYDTLSGFQDLSGYATKPDIEDTPDFSVEDVSEETIDEITRLTLELYQKITDASSAILAANNAASNANAKATLAENAATQASNAATNASTQASYAHEQGDYAKEKADEIEDAKGEFSSLDDRLDYMEENAGSVEFVESEAGTFPF